MENIGYQALILSILGVDGEFPTPEQAFAYLINGTKFDEANEKVLEEQSGEQMVMAL